MTSHVSTRNLLEMKKRGDKIAALTAYDVLTARILDESGIDVILVGDSAGNVFAGYETTHPVTMEEMLYHTRAVKNGIKRSLLVSDMPFLSFQCGLDEAVKNAGKFLQAGAQAVKLEGGEPIAPVVRHIVNMGIPVMGHIGLTPQRVYEFGGYITQGKTPEAEEKLLQDSKILEEAGVFALVLEKVTARAAERISREIRIPTIGIGAGAGCDGQILVTPDILGMNPDFHPKYLRIYANLHKNITDAVADYIQDVKKGEFPSDKESYFS